MLKRILFIQMQLYFNESLTEWMYNAKPVNESWFCYFFSSIKSVNYLQKSKHSYILI